jgi:hypothetical protein
VGIDFGVWNNKLRGALMYITRKQKAYINQSHNHSLPVLVGIPSNTGSLYNRGFDFEMHYDLIRDKDLRVTLNFVGNYNRSALLISQILLENL